MSLTLDIGIDLGTSNSVIARARAEANAPELLRDDQGELLFPSCVHLDAHGQVSVGGEARGRLDSDPENTCIEFKRLMGSNEERHFAASGRRLTPDALAAEVLRGLLLRASVEAPPCAAVITVPAMFQLPQCDATLRAAKLAGLKHAVLLHEPIAAAIAYSGSSDASDGTSLVYDLGGGTFDISLVRKRAGRLHVVDHAGDNHLGGRDFDRVIARSMAERVREAGALGDFRRSDPRFANAFVRLKAEAERARIALSQVDECRFAVPGLASSDGEHRFDFETTLTRSHVKELIAPLLARTVRLCQQLIERNGLSASAIRRLVLVGGPTRAPGIPELLAEELGIVSQPVVDPMTVVASGAAIFAATQKLPVELIRRRGNADAVELQLEYQPMTTSSSPVLAAKVASPPGRAVASARVRRVDGGFDSGPIDLGARGTFALPLRLRENMLNRFSVELFDGAGTPAPAAVDSFTILHGLSIAQPPLSESVGVMLADNTVSWCLRKGTALPARGSVTCATTVAIGGEPSSAALNVPIVQGESAEADRNRVIGVLLIRTNGAGHALPAGAEVDLEISIDESLHTSARGYVRALGRWFDDVIRLELEPTKSDSVAQRLSTQQERLVELADMARELETECISDCEECVRDIEGLLEEGDRDSIDLADQLLRRMTRQLDASARATQADAMQARFDSAAQRVAAWVERLGNASEKRQHDALVSEYEQALANHDTDAAERKLAYLDELGSRIEERTPEYWIRFYQMLRARLLQLGLEASCAAALGRGQTAAAEGETEGLRRVCQELFNALPPETCSSMPVPPSIISHVS